MEEQVLRNEYGEMVHVSHGYRKVRPEGVAGGTPTQVANGYLQAHLEEMGLQRSRMEHDEAAMADDERAADPVIRFSEERDLQGSTVVVYQQHAIGLPIFGARMGVHIDAAAQGVTAVHASMHGEVEVRNPKQKGDREEPETVGRKALAKLLGGALDNLGDGRIECQVVYRFEPDERLGGSEEETSGCMPGPAPRPVELPELPKKRFVKGHHYVVDEVLFEASRQEGEPPVHWRALVEPKSGAVLYLRALVAAATGMVFVRDPQTQSGAMVTGASSSATLNPFRKSVALPSLQKATPQPLSGEYVELVKTADPVLEPPTIPNPSGSFDFDARSDGFTAANAYYHCDVLFRTMEELGFDVPHYFGGTTFPVPVDHRAFGNMVNAQAPGNAHGDGVGAFRLGVIQAGQQVGIATSNRVIWHEFGHALLWNHVHDANFGFAHSAGDSLGAILNDPDTRESDRYDSFPWVSQGTPVGRRHDRRVSDGWAWFGPQYNVQYQGEQVLSTTLFRLYRALGGDAASLATRRRASRAVLYLIFKAIGTLTSTTPHPQVLVSALQHADLTTEELEGVAGGAVHKVVRWAFEKQGLFQPDAMPGKGNTVMRQGDPPEVDVYVDDGRGGEYGYAADHWSCPDLWVRHAPDGGSGHQRPVVGATNHLYVRVKNRGLKAAREVRVDAYHCLPGTGMAFPDDWKPMTTPNLPADGPIVSGGETVVGPFEFVPERVAHECLLAIVSAEGDPGNDTTLTGTVQGSRFVPFDNNVAQRNVHPVVPLPGPLLTLLGKHPLWVRNPRREAANCRVEVTLPHFLQELGWSLRVVSEGGAKFELGPRERRRVVLALGEGKDFSPQVARQAVAGGDDEIRVLTHLDDEISGGMTYPLEFPPEGGGEADGDGDGDGESGAALRVAADGGAVTVEEVLRLLGERRVRTIRLEIDLEDDGES